MYEVYPTLIETISPHMQAAQWFQSRKTRKISNYIYVIINSWKPVIKTKLKIF
jgi:hypothetical protein